MILVSATLNVKPGQETAFEAAMRIARPIVAATPGFKGMDVMRCVETPNRYLILVKWESLEAHTIAFRKSDRYQQCWEMLHQYYEPFPTVEHYCDPQSFDSVSSN